MCDTFYIPAEKSATGYPILAKNSDREPNEPQLLLHIPRRTDEADHVKTTFITVPHTRLRHAIILSKPADMWGAEIGINEHGLAIGNEAVFTKVPIAKKNDGLTGMDMIRLALESCTTAAEACDKICAWSVSPGQDACGGFENKDFFYHNSYIIADPREAFVLETAGPYWAWKKLTGFHAISNRLSLGTDYDQASPGVMGKDFAATYSASFMTRMAKGRERRALCSNKAGQIIIQRPFTIADAFAVLRTHHVDEGFLPHHGGMNSICLHATGLMTPSQTTGSMVMELRAQGRPQIWATGSSAPCLSLYKPVFFSHVENYFGEKFVTGSGWELPIYWFAWEEWHRRALTDYPLARKLWQQHLLPLEQEWLSKWTHISDDEAVDYSSNCFASSLDCLHTVMNQLPKGKYPGLWYARHWRRSDRNKMSVKFEL